MPRRVAARSFGSSGYVVVELENKTASTRQETSSDLISSIWRRVEPRTTESGRPETRLELRWSRRRSSSAPHTRQRRQAVQGQGGMLVLTAASLAASLPARPRAVETHERDKGCLEYGKYVPGKCMPAKRSAGSSGQTSNRHRTSRLARVVVVLAMRGSSGTCIG